MNRLLHVLGAVLLFAAVTKATELDNFIDETPSDPRIFWNFNSTSITISYASLIAGAFTLLALFLLGALLAYLLFGIGGDDTGTGYGYGYDTYSSYGNNGGGHSGRAFVAADPYAVKWDQLNILDMLAMAEEVYRKFDYGNVDCQKRLICEMHQNDNRWGSAARKMTNAFGYLQYLELLNLPSDIRMVINEYVDAAQKGKSLNQKECADVFPSCDFSVKKLLEKYGGSSNDI